MLCNGDHRNLMLTRGTSRSSSPSSSSQATTTSKWDLQSGISTFATVPTCTISHHSIWKQGFESLAARSDKVLDRLSGQVHRYLASIQYWDTARSTCALDCVCPITSSAKSSWPHAPSSTRGRNKTSSCSQANMSCDRHCMHNRLCASSHLPARSFACSSVPCA